MRLHVRITRHAISPRFAIRIFEKGGDVDAKRVCTSRSILFYSRSRERAIAIQLSMRGSSAMEITKNIQLSMRGSSAMEITTVSTPSKDPDDEELTLLAEIPRVSILLTPV
jgi:hypothetical protein